ncbi:HemK2/MTQ2 family protein methyltransferase [Halobacteriales archaeon Cl-PHB]
MTGDDPKLAELRDLDQVYQAAEDSDLLARTAVDYATADDLVVDVGTGSGYVAATVAEEAGATVLGTDLNPMACRQASAQGVDAVRGNLLDPIGTDSADLVVCNPPYLPTPPDREWNDWMEHALSGGDDGRAVIEPFLEGLRRPLKPDGEALLLCSSLTGIDAVRATARSNGLTTMEVADEAHPSERLVVLHLVPATGNN